MSWKSWIPLHGNHSVRKKLREIDQAGVGIPVIIVMFFQKSLETLLNTVSGELPMPLWTTYFLTGLTVFIIYVYDKEMHKAVEKAKEN